MLRATSLLVVFALCAAHQAWAQVTLTQGPDQIAVAIDGKPFTVFHIGGANLNRPYLHPLRSASGKIVNRSFPSGQLAGETTDHPHHAGLFYGHGDVNGYNYWAVQSVANPQPPPGANFGRIVVDKVASVKSGKESGSVDVVLTWLKPDGAPLLKETRRTTFYAHPELRIIDFDFDFAAIERSSSATPRRAPSRCAWRRVLDEPPREPRAGESARTGKLRNAPGRRGGTQRLGQAVGMGRLLRTDRRRKGGRGDDGPSRQSAPSDLLALARLRAALDQSVRRQRFPQRQDAERQPDDRAGRSTCGSAIAS